MVNFKKTISIILILSVFLSLSIGFLYNKNSALAEDDEDFCAEFSCPAECSEGPVYNENTDSCSCINCEISCEAGSETFVNKSIVPLNEAESWTCGTEIPVGEIMDRTAFLAERMLLEFGGIIKSGEEMANKTDELLTDYKDWSCDDWCQTGCYKYYYISEGELQSGEDNRCPLEAQSVPKGIYTGDECKENYTQCKSCEDCGERCCWQEEYCPDPEFPKITISCKYCKKESFCQEKCVPYPCQGCCRQYFGTIINNYTDIESLQKALKDEINETNSPEKFTKTYILEQLDFSRCELAQCWIPAEDYYDVLEGKKTGKHLLTCKGVSEIGLLDDDQISAITTQIITDWEELLEAWGEMEEASWWQKPIFFFKLLGKTIWLGGKILWIMIEEWFNSGQEEGCYPTNYYCCEL